VAVEHRCLASWDSIRRLVLWRGPQSTHHSRGLGSVHWVGVEVHDTRGGGVETGLPSSKLF